jgi:hypothetical protein
MVRGGLCLKHDRPARGGLFLEIAPMIYAMNPVASGNLQARFMEILPRIEAGARIYFRDIRCAIRKADYVAEAVAIAWKWFCRLMAKGKDVTQFVAALARMAARAVRGGRRVGAGETANDVMSSLAQRRHGFKVVSLPRTRTGQDILYSSPIGQEMQDTMEECLKDNTVTAIPDQVAFRADFPAWLKTLSSRERRIIRAMALNERTKDLSPKFNVSWGRISQMRREFHDGWHRFVGDIEDKMTA